MAYSRTMNEIPTNWADVGKILGIVIGPVILLWKFINDSFQARADEKRQEAEDKKEFIKNVVKEAMEQGFAPIKKDIDEIKRNHDAFKDVVNRQYIEVIKEINK